MYTRKSSTPNNAILAGDRRLFILLIINNLLNDLSAGGGFRRLFAAGRRLKRATKVAIEPLHLDWVPPFLPAGSPLPFLFPRRFPDAFAVAETDGQNRG